MIAIYYLMFIMPIQHFPRVHYSSFSVPLLQTITQFFILLEIYQGIFKEFFYPFCFFVIHTFHTERSFSILSLLITLHFVGHLVLSKLKQNARFCLYLRLFLVLRLSHLIQFSASFISNVRQLALSVSASLVPAYPGTHYPKLARTLKYNSFTLFLFGFPQKRSIRIYFHADIICLPNKQEQKINNMVT